MNTSPFRQINQQSVSTTVMLAPVYNALMSLSLLTANLANMAVEPWIIETAARLTPDQRQHNRLIFEGLGSALIPDEPSANFQAYLDSLVVTSPETLRDRVLQGLTQSVSASVPLTISDLLADEQAFLHCVMHNQQRGSIDQDLYADAHRLLNDPAAMHALILTHLRTLWDTWLATEWQRHAKRLDGLLRMFEHKADLDEVHEPEVVSASQAIRAFIRQDLPDSVSSQLSGVKHINFVLSPHIRLHATQFTDNATLWIFVLGDFWALPLRTEPVKRSEVLGQIRALSDETRLKILEILAAYEPLRAQEVIDQVDVSQPTVSRHLQQLRKAGIITEEREPDIGKLYRLDRSAIDKLYHTLTELLSPKNARLVLTDARLDQPIELRRFMDREARITVWPKKMPDKELILNYLAEKFTLNTDYTESQVNELLGQWHTYDDPYLLRRALIQVGHLQRTKDGARYWRTAGDSSEAK